MKKFRKELEQLINKCSMENGSDTPDFILAEYLVDCLKTFDKAIMTREKWYDRLPKYETKEPINECNIIKQCTQDYYDALAKGFHGTYDDYLNTKSNS